MAVIQECLRCQSRLVCVMGQVEPAAYPMIRSTMQRQTRLSPGDVLFYPGMTLERLYLVRYGNFKNVWFHPDGRTHTSSLHGSGDVLGLEGLELGHHPSEVTALQHASVCVFHYESWCDLAARIPTLQRAWLKTMSRRMRRDGQHMLLLGCLNGEERVASLLLMLWQRRESVPADTLNLMMTRQEIGNYLGMTLESVSRHLSQFQRRGWIRLDRRRVKLLQLTALEGLRGAGMTGDQKWSVDSMGYMGINEQKCERA